MNYMNKQNSSTYFPEFIPNHNTEKVLKEKLIQYLKRCGSIDPETNADQLSSLSGGFKSRFDYFIPYIDENAKHCLLISGCAIGSELIVARKYGFQEIYGTEISKDYLEIAGIRLADAKGFHLDLYDGLHLPYHDKQFTMVYSGHVIEHTISPYKYFKEHMRVLSPSGIFFLEFPNRYHTTELHTNLPSVEFLPWPLRWLALKFLSSKLSPFSYEKRKFYDVILKTLKPISTWQIRLYLILSGHLKSRILHKYSPRPGFMRILIKK